MPLTKKGDEILAKMEERYGTEKGKEVFYASRNKGTITGVDAQLLKDEAAMDALAQVCDGYAEKDVELDAMVAACDAYAEKDSDTNAEAKASKTLDDKFLSKWRAEANPSKAPATLKEYLKTFDALNMLRGRADWLHTFEKDPKIKSALARIRDKADADRRAYGDKYWPRFMKGANKNEEDISNEKRKRDERNEDAYKQFKKGLHDDAGAELDAVTAACDAYEAKHDGGPWDSPLQPGKIYTKEERTKVMEVEGKRKQEKAQFNEQKMELQERIRELSDRKKRLQQEAKVASGKGASMATMQRLNAEIDRLSKTIDDVVAKRDKHMRSRPMAQGGWG